MFKKIKNFFKWIADHTGISWIAKKISSGWKWLFGGKSSNAKQNLSSERGKSSSNTLTKTLDNKVNHEKPVVADYQIHSNGDDSRADITQSKEDDKLPIIAGICENTSRMLELFVMTNHTGKVFGGGTDLSGNPDLNSTQINDRLTVYTRYVQSEEGKVFRITYDKTEVKKDGVFLNIKSVVSADNQSSSNEFVAMKRILGLSEKKAVISVTQISKDPIITSKISANSNQNLNPVDIKQHINNRNKSVV